MASPTPIPLSGILSDVGSVTSNLFTSVGTVVNTLTQYPILLVGVLIGLSGAIVGLGIRLVKSVRG